MKELRRSSPIRLRKSGLKCRRTELEFFFSYLRFLSQTSTIHRTAGEGVSYLFISFLPLPPASETLRISRVIATDSSPLHIAGRWARNRNLWFLKPKSLTIKLFKIPLFKTCTGRCCC